MPSGKAARGQPHVIHAVGNPDVGRLGIQLLDRSEFVGMLKDYGDRVLENAKKICKKNGISANLVMKEGNVANEILQRAKKDGIDLVVIGSRGPGRLRRHVPGSTSGKIVSYARRPVLAVKWRPVRMVFNGFF